MFRGLFYKVQIIEAVIKSYWRLIWAKNPSDRRYLHSVIRESIEEWRYHSQRKKGD
jgi:hypothetical protein